MFNSFLIMPDTINGASGGYGFLNDASFVSKNKKYE
jgi:hypothetical protein